MIILIILVLSGISSFVTGMTWLEEEDLKSGIPFILSVSVLLLTIYGGNAYFDNTTYIETQKLPGVVMEKYISQGDRQHTVYKTAIKITEGNDEYAVTLDDSHTFNNTLIGSKITVEKKVIYKKKDNSVMTTEYTYIK